MKLIATLIITIAFTLIADAQGDAPAKLDGTWNVISRNDKKLENRKWIFKDAAMIEQRPDKTRDGKVKIDAAKKYIDLLGDAAGIAGIYEFSSDGKKLTICGAEIPDGKKPDDVRPTKIEEKKGLIVWVLERAK